MSAVKAFVVSPLWNGEFTPENERADLSCHKHAIDREAGQSRIATPEEAMLAQCHIGIRQAGLQLPDGCPLKR